MVIVGAIVPLLIQNATGQGTAISDTPETGVVLSMLSEPNYPPLARQASISGDVEVKLGIRKDGSIESAVVISGHPMLKQTALESAQQSRFECRKCGAEVTMYSLIYSFELATAADVVPNHNESRGLQVIQSENRVRIIAEPVPIHIYFSNVQVRSAKCLYLWRCGYRWGGEDYYYYRVRSAKCAYLWRCGLRHRSSSGP